MKVVVAGGWTNQGSLDR